MTDKKKTIVALTGAGVSAESGIRTFRDSDGLWEGYSVDEVATIEAWQWNKEKMLAFYNQRRAQAASVEPNAAHFALKALEDHFRVHIVTQNVDSLHERAGSSHVLHLHGKLSEVKSSVDDSLIYDLGDKPVKLGDKCEKGSQLRPNVVWFGEQVPEIPNAQRIMAQADICLIIGTSLVVYPAAALVYDVPLHAPIFVVDPHKPAEFRFDRDITFIQKRASEGVPELVKHLIENHA